MSGLCGLLFKQMRLPSESEITGKTIIITGPNTGLGKEAVRHALALGASMVIMGARTISKAEQAIADIESTIDNVRDRVMVWEVDLESFESVQKFTTRAREYVELEGGKIDIAIMNAGIATTAWAKSTTGWEKSLQVNVLSTALLSLQLLPLLLQTRKQYPAADTPHLTILSSDIHKSIKFTERHSFSILQILNDEDQWQKSQALGGATERDGVSKLFDIYIAQTLADLVPRDRQDVPLVIVNTVTPGFCKSDLLTREKAPLMLKIVQALIARSVAEGSKTLLHAAVQDADTHGEWLENESIANPGEIVTSADAEKVRLQVWKEIVQVLRTEDPTLQTTFA